MSEVEKPLKKAQKLFLDEYFANGENPVAAHRVAYPRANEASTLTEAYRKLKKLQKTSYFSSKNSEKLRKEEEFKRKAEEKFQINREWLLEQHKKVYESAMSGDEILTEAGSYTKLDRSAANKALDQLCKMVGEYADIKAKSQIDNQNGSNAVVMSDEQFSQFLARKTNDI